MSQQSSTPRRSVAFAAMFLIVSVTAFVAAFHLFDGVYYGGLVASEVRRLVSRVSSPGAASRSEAPAGELQLPPGMPQEFALRLWQEQLDSQGMIERLIVGEISSVKIREVERKDDIALLRCTVEMADSTAAPGTIALRRFGSDWFVSYASGQRRSSTGGLIDILNAGDAGAPSGPLPKLADVDVELLNTMIAEQLESQAVIDEYLDGTVKEIVIDEVRGGPNTVTMDITMEETHGTGYARVVAIQSDDGKSSGWFLARFIKTGHDPPPLD